MTRSGSRSRQQLPSAAFLSAGGYHHHLGLNSWQSQGQGPASERSPGLRRVEFELGDEGCAGGARAQAHRQRLRAGGNARARRPAVSARPRRSADRLPSPLGSGAPSALAALKARPPQGILDDRGVIEGELRQAVGGKPARVARVVGAADGFLRLHRRRGRRSIPSSPGDLAPACRRRRAAATNVPAGPSPRPARAARRRRPARPPRRIRPAGPTRPRTASARAERGAGWEPRLRSAPRHPPSTSAAPVNRCPCIADSTALAAIAAAPRRSSAPAAPPRACSTPPRHPPAKSLARADDARAPAQPAPPRRRRRRTGSARAPPARARSR